MKIVLRATRSQQMALIDVLLTYMRLKDEPQEFLNVSEDVVTTTSDLLTFVSGMQEVEMERNPDNAASPGSV